MARIDLVKGGVALGVGVLNGVLEKQDAGAGRVGMLRRWSDIAVLAGVVGGAAAQVFNFQTEMAETVELASASLLGKKLSALIGIGIESGAFSTASRGIKLIAAPNMEEVAPKTVAPPRFAEEHIIIGG